MSRLGQIRMTLKFTDELAFLSPSIFFHLLSVQLSEFSINLSGLLVIPAFSVYFITRMYNRWIMENNGSLFLKRNDEETFVMAKNLSELLKSSEEANQQLGLNMVLGGGIHSLFFYDLLMLYLWNPYYESRKLAGEVLEKYLDGKLFGELKKHRKEYEYYPTDNLIEKYLKKLNLRGLDINQLSILFYKQTGKGKSFCFQLPQAFSEVAKDFLLGSSLHLNKSKIKKLQESIKEFSQIKILYLQDNHLKELPECLKDLTKLYLVNLKNNLLVTFPEQLLALKELKTLDLSKNKITRIPFVIDVLQKLEYLYLAENQLSNLPDELMLLKKLKVLHLAGNPVEENRHWLDKFRKALPGCALDIRN